MIVGFFYNKLTHVILYHVIGTCYDRESSFVGVDEELSRWREGRFFLWEPQSRRDDFGIILEESGVLLSTPP